MLDFCLHLFCPGLRRKQRRERYISPPSLALSRSRRRYPLPSPLYPLSAPRLQPPEQLYEPRPITPIYYPEPELESEPEFLFPQRFQPIPFKPILRREPSPQFIRFVEPEAEVYYPFPRPRSPPGQHIHLLQQLPPPYTPSPPASPPRHYIHVLPPPFLPPPPRSPSPSHTHIHLLAPPPHSHAHVHFLTPPPRTPSPPHTHIHLLAPPPRSPSPPHIHAHVHIRTPPPRTPSPQAPNKGLSLIPLSKPNSNPNSNSTMNPPPRPHPHPHPHSNHSANHSHHSPSPFSRPHRHNPPQNHTHSAGANANSPNTPFADLICDVLQSYLQINLPPGAASSIARLMSVARSPSDPNSIANANANPSSNSSHRGTGNGRNRSGSRDRNRRGGQGRANTNVITNGNGNDRGNRGSDPDEDQDQDQDQDQDSGHDTRSRSQKIRDRICRINVCAQLANGMVKPSMLNADVHPKVDTNGEFPRIFNTPKRVREFMNMDAHTLDQFLSVYGLPKTDDAKRNPRAALVHRVVIEPADLAGLSSSDPRLANFSTCPNAHHHKIYTCQNCDVHGCQADEASNDAKRGILFENLSVGAVWLSLWGGHGNGNGNGNMMQQGGVLVVGGNANQGTRGVVARGGGVVNSAGGTTGAAATGASNLAAGAGTGGRRLILTQGGQGAQNQGSGANGVIPNRLNNNNIGLAQPANHNSHGNVSGGRLVARRRSNS